MPVEVRNDYKGQLGILLLIVLRKPLDHLFDVVAEESFLAAFSVTLAIQDLINHILKYSIWTIIV
jgi:hypothetical protein